MYFCKTECNRLTRNLNSAPRSHVLCWYLLQYQHIDIHHITSPISDNFSPLSTFFDYVSFFTCFSLFLFLFYSHFFFYVWLLLRICLNENLCGASWKTMSAAQEIVREWEMSYSRITLASPSWEVSRILKQQLPKGNDDSVRSRRIPSILRDLTPHYQSLEVCSCCHNIIYDDLPTTNNYTTNNNNNDKSP